MNIECIAPVNSTRKQDRAVRECIELFEIVSGPSLQSRAALARTWTKCSSYDCAAGRCDFAVRDQTRILIDEFVAIFSGRNSRNPALITNNRKQTDADLRSPVGDTRFSEHDPPSGSTLLLAKYSGPEMRTISLLFYPLYIMTCTAVLLFWQFRKRVY